MNKDILIKSNLEKIEFSRKWDEIREKEEYKRNGKYLEMLKERE